MTRIREKKRDQGLAALARKVADVQKTIESMEKKLGDLAISLPEFDLEDFETYRDWEAALETLKSCSDSCLPIERIADMVDYVVLCGLCNEHARSEFLRAWAADIYKFETDSSDLDKDEQPKHQAFADEVVALFTKTADKLKALESKMKGSE